MSLDQVLDFAAHERVADNSDVTEQDLGLLLAGGLADILRLLHGVAAELVYGIAVTLKLRVYVSNLFRYIIKRLFDDNHDSADTDTVGSANTF